MQQHASFVVDPLVKSDKAKGILLGYFGSGDDPTHVLVVNLDYRVGITTTVVGPGPMEVFGAETGKWVEASNKSRAKISVMPGSGKLLRLKAKR